ncbi:MAG: hypothetical protein EOM19_02735 [Candidatus Moranbacteria bacterium]|nr:hypothetical protein [Candidatus Moranbacteria bacterium]
MKQKNVYVTILVTLILLVTVVYIFFSLQQKEVLPPQEPNISPTSVRQQLHGTIKEVRMEASGVYLVLLTKLPVPTDTLTPEEYDTYTPETFPKEEKEWKFFIPSVHQDGDPYFIEGEELSVIFESSPSEEEYVEVLFFM